MKKIVVLSDTHGNISAIEKILPIMKESDYVFHLGDYSKDIELYRRELGDKLYSVKGNCDGSGPETVLDIEGLKIILVHGDFYGVKNGVENLYFHAKSIGANVVFYGHTHCALIEEYSNVTMINPGCMKGFYDKTYCYAVIHNGKITAKIVSLNG